MYFEEQGIHSNQPSAEFYITIYGSIAQSESENISANVKWGKAQSAKEDKVNFRYQNFLGYRKGTDGKPEIVPEEAETIRLIYGLFLAGNSLNGIAHELEKRGILSPAGKEKWQFSTVRSILSNEKYKGDAIINKTYITDCIIKKVRANNGERPKYYVENSHPAIIDSATFGRVQEELARRSGKHKVKQVGTKTEQGKYSSKYALTCLFAENVKRRIADAPGQQAVKRKLYGGALTALISERNTVTTHLVLKKAYCKRQLWKQ